jgi:two-component sensor histidine kinase
VRALTADNFLQQDLITEFGELLTQHLTSMDKVAASEPGSGVGRSMVPAMSVDANRMSALIATMRQQEDALLQTRSTRADNLVAVMLPTLCFSAAFVALLIVMLARLINRLIRERDQNVSEKETELAATEMMMREVDHRVRNSLGLVYNLLTFQQRRKGVDEATQTFLAEAANQILVVARMHERLYRSGAPQQLRIDHYLADLCNDVAAYALPPESRSAIRVHAAAVDVPAEKAVWLGLIVVEFVTNALKYGSPTPQSPIQIEVARADEGLRIEVSDQGHGLPADFDPKACKGLGMQVVALLVKQLHGVLAIDRTWSGARFVVTIPADAAVAVR